MRVALYLCDRVAALSEHRVCNRDQLQSIFPTPIPDSRLPTPDSRLPTP
ncbi:MAG: hypothetical protein F6K55_26005 [Moorea sp. SIO4A3]|nr:hypothetical protein [Moorena sp. SIO4A3]